MFNLFALVRIFESPGGEAALRGCLSRINLKTNQKPINPYIFVTGFSIALRGYLPCFRTAIFFQRPLFNLARWLLNYNMEF